MGRRKYAGRVVRHLRRRKFVRAYEVLRDEAERHRAAGHDTEFIAVNESRVLLMCHGCPDLQPDPTTAPARNPDRLDATERTTP